MFRVDHELDGNNLNGRHDSFKFIMYTIWIMHIVQFLANTMMEIEDNQKPGKEVESINDTEESLLNK